MAIVTLSDAAEYVRTSRATAVILTAMRAIGRVFTFREERYNRVSRYVSVVDAYKKGVPIAEITERFGCTKRTVYDYINRAGVVPRSFVPSEIKAAIIRDYKRDIPTAAIASMNNVSLRYVMKVAKEAGLSRKRKA